MNPCDGTSGSNRDYLNPSHAMRPLTNMDQTAVSAGRARQLPHHDLLTYIDQNNLTPDFYTYTETLASEVGRLRLQCRALLNLGPLKSLAFD
jgi:hypothetical protein